VFENRVLRRIFGPKDKVTGEWGKQHIESLMTGSPNIIRVTKSRTLGWAGHVARMGERKGAHWVLVRKPEGANHFKDPGVDGRIILRWIFRK
jgi:hypothetical protein